MPPTNKPRPGSFGTQWLQTIGVTEAALRGPPKHRVLDAFMPARDHAFRMAQDPRVVDLLQRAWVALKRSPANEPLADQIMLELQALRHAAELAPAEAGGVE